MYDKKGFYIHQGENSSSSSESPCTKKEKRIYVQKVRRKKRLDFNNMEEALSGLKKTSFKSTQ